MPAERRRRTLPILLAALLMPWSPLGGADPAEIHERPTGVDQSVSNLLLAFEESDQGMREDIATSLRAVAIDARALVIGPYLTVQVSDDDRALIEHVYRPTAAVALPVMDAYSGCSVAPAESPDDVWWINKRSSLAAAREQGLDGSGVKVAIVDTGVSMVGSLPASFSGDWYDPIGSTSFPVDDCGHGTAVASLVVDTSVGSAPGATWAAARAGSRDPLDPSRAAIDLREAINAWDWLATLPEPPSVIVNSWGTDEFANTPEQNALRAALVDLLSGLGSRGILPLFAAGAGPELSVPADWQGVLAVGSVGADGSERAGGPFGPSRHDKTGSVAGPTDVAKPDVVAPGEGVLGLQPNGSYGRMYGTSLATGFAAGVAAVIKQAHPWLTADELAHAIRGGASFRDWSGTDPTRPNNVVGYGVVHSLRSIAAADTFGRVAVIGDYAGRLEQTLVAQGFRVSSFHPEDFAELAGSADRFGTILIAGVPRGADVDGALSASCSAGAHLILLSDPGLANFDAVQALLGDAVQEASASARLVGNAVPGSWLELGTSIPIIESGRAFQYDRLPPDLAAAGLTDSDGFHLFVRMSDNCLMTVLTNLSPSAADVIVQPEAKAALLKAVHASLEQRLAEPLPDDAPEPRLGEFLIIGDATGALANRLWERGYAVASFRADELPALARTLREEEYRRTILHLPRSVYALVYDSIHATPAAIAEIEDARRDAGVQAVALSGEETLGRLGPMLAFETGTATTTLVSGTPHAANNYAIRGTTAEAAREALTVITQAAAVRTVIWATAQEIPLVVETTDARGIPVIIGGLGSVDAAESDGIVERIRLSAVLAFGRERVTTNLVLDDSSVRANSFLDDATGAHVVNGLYFAGSSLLISDVTSPIVVQNCVFDGGLAGVRVEGSGRVTLKGNTFIANARSISIVNYPDVSIHHNRFLQNEFALVRLISDAGSTPTITYAGLNFFSELAGLSGDTASLFTGGRDVAAGRANRLDHPSFRIVPTYVDETFQELFPPEWDGFLSTVGETDRSISHVEASSTYQLVYREGRDFAFKATNLATGAATNAIAVPSAPGWVSLRITLAPATWLLEVTSNQGRGDYYLGEGGTLRWPKTTFVEDDFRSTSSQWQLAGGATVVSSAGYRGTPGALRLPPDASASRPITADPWSLAAAAYFKGASDSAGLFQILWGETPLFRVYWTGTAFVLGEGTPASPRTHDSWHKVEVRLNPPLADLYVDNAFIGSGVVDTAPAVGGFSRSIVLDFRSDSGTTEVDSVAVFIGESLTGAIKEEDFEDGLGDLVFDVTGTSAAALLDGGSARTYSQVTEVEWINGLQSSVDTDGFGRSGGSATYANGQSIYLRSDGDGALVAAELHLPVDTRHYSFEQYVSIPTGQSFAEFGLLDLRGSDGNPILRVGLEDNNTHIDVSGARTATNIASLEPGRWHRLRATVSEDAATIAINDIPVIAVPIEGRAPARWLAGNGVGRAMLDNLRFGYASLVQSDPSAAPTLDAAWTRFAESNQAAAGIRVVDQVPEIPDPARHSERTPLASHAIHLLAPAAEASRTYLQRNLPSAQPLRIHSVFYLPAGLTSPTYDGFHLMKAQTAMTPRASLTIVGDPRNANRGDIPSIIIGTTRTDVGVGLIRERWYDLTLELAPDGSGVFYLDGTKLAPSIPPGAFPTTISIGDVTSQLQPATAGATGHGEIYIDDVFVEVRNTDPTVTPSAPISGSTVGGIVRATGKAADADPFDAISSVTLVVSKDGSVVHTARATGTTQWYADLDTRAWPAGTYSISFTATDGRLNSAPQTRTVIVDNRPIGGFTSPAAGSALGGISILTGSAASRFPLSPDETVDVLRYRIDAGEWLELPAATQWTVSWDTRSASHGAHSISVEAWKWGHVSQWIRSFSVDNSPTLTVEGPGPGPHGGTLTIRGGVVDRFPVGPSDEVDLLEYRVDSGSWIQIGPSTTWQFALDTHSLLRGQHAVEIRALEDLSTSSVVVDINIDNSPLLSVENPSSEASVGGVLVVRGDAIDVAPTATRPSVERIEAAFDSGPYVEAAATSLSSGRVTWKVSLPTSTLSDGTHTLRVRAVDGLDSTIATLTVNVQNGAVNLAQNVPRYSSLEGSGRSYTFVVPTAATRLTLDYLAGEAASGSKLFVRFGQPASESSHDWTSTGDGTHEQLVLYLTNGLKSGTYFVYVKAAAPTDYRLLAAHSLV